MLCAVQSWLRVSDASMLSCCAVLCCLQSVGHELRGALPGHARLERPAGHDTLHCHLLRHAIRHTVHDGILPQTWTHVTRTQAHDTIVPTPYPPKSIRHNFCHPHSFSQPPIHSKVLLI